MTVTKPDFSELHTWWQSLEQSRGTRAELRRARSVTEVVMLPAFHFARRKYFKSFARSEQLRLAMILGLLAHVKQPTADAKLAEQMATGDRPRVSELRFKRLLRYEREDLYQPLVRVIRLLDGQVNIGDLAKLCFYWGDRIRRELAFDYYPHIKT